MTAFLAIVLDTWRQSRRQVVFVLLLVSLAAVVGGALWFSEPRAPRLGTWELGPAQPRSLGWLDERVEGVEAFAVGDLDGDGVDEAVLIAAGALRCWTLAERGAQARGGPSALPGCRGALIAELDSAPGAELVTWGPEGVRVWRWSERGLQALGPGLSGPVSDLAAGDLDGDGDLDLVAAGPAARVWLNGRSSWEGGATLGALDRIVLADADGDGDLDLFGSRERSVSVWTSGPGAELEAPRLVAELEATPRALAAAQLDATPGAELVAALATRVEVYGPRGPGYELLRARFGATPGVERIRTPDYDGDGRADLLLLSSEARRSLLWPQLPPRPDQLVFGAPLTLPRELGPQSDLYRRGLELGVVGLWGGEGIDIPLYEDGNPPPFTSEDDNWREVHLECQLSLAPGLDQDEAGERMRAVEAGRPRLRRHAELLAIKGGKLIYTLSLMLFVAACAGYFPGLINDGGLDLVLARPIARLQIYLGKLLGGLVLYTLATGAALLTLVVGIGLRFGVTPWRVLLMLPLFVLAAGVLYAILAAIGVVVRSTALPMLFGLVFFLAIDTGLGIVIQLQAVEHRFGGVWGQAIEWAAVLLPNFDLLKHSATSLALGLDALAVRPILTAIVWGLGFVAIGFAWFKRADY